MELVEIKSIIQPTVPGAREQRRLYEFALRVSVKQTNALPAGAASAPERPASAAARRSA